MLRRCDFLRDIPRRLWFERRAWENPFRYFGVRRHVSSKSSINLPECRCANLISRFMKLMLGRLSEDWQARWGHPGVMVETFVDSQFFQGTAYKASGWSMLGATAGFARTGQGKDYYVAHGRPKQLWVRELCKGAAKKLCAPALAEACGGENSRAALPGKRCGDPQPERPSERSTGVSPPAVAGLSVAGNARADRDGAHLRSGARAARPGSLCAHALARPITSFEVSL
jgi:hypothetical protein